MGKRTRTTEALTLILCVGVLFLGHCGQRSDVTRIARTALNDRSFTIVTYNIDAYNGTPRETMEAITAIDADIVFLQEVPTDWGGKLKSLQRRYPYTLVRSDPSAAGLAFLCRFPLRDVKFIAPSGGGWMPAWLVVADTPLGPVQILNVHLRPLIRGGSKVLGYLTVGPIHRREIESCLTHVDPGLPLVVVGDFNEVDTGDGAMVLKRRGMLSALAQFDRTSPTWQGKVGGINVFSRVDHIFHDHTFHCPKARVVNSGASDHRPVVASFERSSAAVTSPATKPTAP